MPGSLQICLSLSNVISLAPNLGKEIQGAVMKVRLTLKTGTQWKERGWKDKEERELSAKVWRNWLLEAHCAG